MIKLRKTGYHSRSLVADIALGIGDGLDNALWCYAFVTVIYTGALAVFLPVGVLTMFFGWALMGVFVTLTSKPPLHMANTDEKAVVIIASISVLMVADMGAEASTSRGLATLLAIIMISSLAVSAGCYFVGHYRLSRLLELLPFPVVCGFMAGIGWLLLDAGVTVASDAALGPGLIEELAQNGSGLRLALTVICGGALMWVVNHFDKSWALPAASAAIIAVFYLIAASTGTSNSELTSAGWLIEVAKQEKGAFELLSDLSFSDIDKRFIFRMIPEILTLVFLVLLGISMSLSALKAASKLDISTPDEFKIFSGSNLICGLIACPPGYTDVVASTMFEKFGATSRWMPLISSTVCLLVILVGAWVIGFLPMVLVGATIFLFAFQTLYEWLHDNVKSFSLLDYAIVWVIFGTVIFAGFTKGIIVGVILTVLLFVFRYSMISAIQARHTLRDHRSSVERSAHNNMILDRRGKDVIVYTLRGFLFFGTANSILDTIKEDPAVVDGTCKAVMLDMKWVTGIDISAINTFVAIRNICEAAGIVLAYSGISSGLEKRVSLLDPASFSHDHPLIFSETDFAIEYLEDLLLDSEKQKAAKLSIRDYLGDIVEDEEKVSLLLKAMNKVDCKEGETLFKQGDRDSGLFIVEQGTLSAHIQVSEDRTLRVKKFAAGSLIGELSAYMADRKRTAAVIADEDSVLYQLSTEYLQTLDTLDFKLAACIHELVATTLAERVSYMNRRLMVQLD